MDNNSLINQEHFWLILKRLSQVEFNTSRSTLMRELGATEFQLNAILVFMQEIGFEFVHEEIEGVKYLRLEPHQKQVKVNFSLLEWVQFQAHFPALSHCADQPYHEDFKLKLIELEDKFKENDLFKPLQALEEIFNQSQPSLVMNQNNPLQQILIFLEESIIERKSIQLQVGDDHLKLFPLKIVYFDGGLNLIAESICDQSLMNFKLSEIDSSFEENGQYLPLHTDGEIEQFISSLRAMQEKVIRLVLKIYSHEDFGINLSQIYFHNPCLFTNPEGDYIWAATLEPSPEVFEWLCDLGTYVEILDPVSFKREFIKYCEDKLKKIA